MTKTFGRIWVLAFILASLAVVGLRAEEAEPLPTAEPFPTTETAQTETSPSMEPAQVNYQQALEAYLRGDYDQAILSAAKSLQADPDLKKSQDLLSVLVLEKEQGAQTEIWLNQKKRDLKALTPTPVPAPEDGFDAIWNEIRSLQKQIALLANTGQVRLLEKRMSSLARLMEKNANSNYGELQVSQAKTLEKIVSVLKKQERHDRSLFWLFVLASLGVILSLFALMRKPPVARRTLEGENETVGG